MVRCRRSRTSTQIVASVPGHLALLPQALAGSEASPEQPREVSSTQGQRTVDVKKSFRTKYKAAVGVLAASIILLPWVVHRKQVRSFVLLGRCRPSLSAIRILQRTKCMVSKGGGVRSLAKISDEEDGARVLSDVCNGPKQSMLVAFKVY